jgi:hypothetical protein
LEDGKRELVWDDYEASEGITMDQEGSHALSESDGWMLSDGGCKLQEDCSVDVGGGDTVQGLVTASVGSLNVVLFNAPDETSLKLEDDEDDNEDEGVLVAHDEGGGASGLEPFPNFSKSSHVSS